MIDQIKKKAGLIKNDEWIEISFESLHSDTNITQYSKVEISENSYGSPYSLEVEEAFIYKIVHENFSGSYSLLCNRLVENHFKNIYSNWNNKIFQIYDQKSRCRYNKSGLVGDEVQMGVTISHNISHFFKHLTSISCQNVLYSKFIYEMDNTYKEYLDDLDEYDSPTTPSEDSLVNLLKFIPTVSNFKNFDIYIEPDNGYFGLIKHARDQNILNMLFTSNNKIIYSVLNEAEGTVNFSGQADFDSNLANSYFIERLMILLADY